MTQFILRYYRDYCVQDILRKIEIVHLLRISCIINPRGESKAVYVRKNIFFFYYHSRQKFNFRLNDLKMQCWKLEKILIDDFSSDFYGGESAIKRKRVNSGTSCAVDLGLFFKSNCYRKLMSRHQR